MLKNFEKEFKDYAKNIVKSEMGRTLTKPSELASRIGMDRISLTNKINRGSFSTSFFFKILQEIGTKEVPVPPKIAPDAKA